MRRSCLERTSATAYAGRSFASEDPYDVDVSIVMRDGRTLLSFVEFPLGRTAANAIAPRDMKAKFEDCATRVLTKAAVAEVHGAIFSFESVSDIREFTTLLEVREARRVEAIAR